jgi:hypothetical protein
MTKRTIYIDGIKIGFKHAVDLLDLINEQIKHHSSKTNKPKTNLIFLANSIHEYMAQWENIKLGDKVEYKPQTIVMKSLFELNKPEPITEPITETKEYDKTKKYRQLEFPFN